MSLLLVACAPPSAEQSAGRASLGLRATSTEGNSYRLRDAEFQIGTADSVLITVSSEADPDAPAIVVSLDPGAYLVELLDGWRLERSDADVWVDVQAELVPPQIVPVDVVSDATTQVVFRFLTDGTIVSTDDGTISIGIEVQECACDDDNVCTDDSCDPADGSCVNAPVADGTDCDADGAAGRCSLGSCEPRRSDIALCGGVECERVDSGTGASIGPVIRGGYTSFYRTILPNGEMWHIERTPFGAGFILHRYLPDGTELPPIRHGLAEVPTIVATHTGKVYMTGTGDNGFPLDTIYRFTDDRSSLEAVAPGREPACGRYSAIFPMPPDPLDPSKEQVLAFGDDLRGAGGYGLFRIDLNDTDGDGVYCTGVVANLTALGIAYVRNVREAPDGAVFVDNNGCCFANSGIHRIENGQATMLRAREAHPNDTTKDIAIGPEDGLLYVLVGGDVSGPAIRIARLDPVTGVELDAMTPPPKPDQNGRWATLDFFPQ